MSKPAVASLEQQLAGAHVPPATTVAGIRKCRAECVGNNPCCGNSRYVHQLHYCKNFDCACHGREYLDSKRKVNP